MRVIYILLFLMIVCPAIAGGRTLIFNTQDFRPFSYKVDGKVAGPAVEIIDAVCRLSGLKSSFRLLPWPRAQKEVRDGDAHALFVIGKNKAREEWLYFSIPIIRTEYGFFAGKSNPLQFKSITDVEGYKVGVYGPSNTSRSLEKIKNQLESMVIEMRPDDESGFRKLDCGRVDAVYSNRDVGFAIIRNLNIKSIRYAGRHRTLDYFIGFSKKYVTSKQVERFNTALEKLHKKGRIKEILDAYHLQPAKLF